MNHEATTSSKGTILHSYDRRVVQCMGGDCDTATCNEAAHGRLRTRTRFTVKAKVRNGPNASYATPTYLPTSNLLGPAGVITLDTWVRSGLNILLMDRVDMRRIAILVTVPSLVSLERAASSLNSCGVHGIDTLSNRGDNGWYVISSAVLLSRRGILRNFLGTRACAALLDALSRSRICHPTTLITKGLRVTQCIRSPLDTPRSLV